MASNKTYYNNCMASWQDCPVNENLNIQIITN